MHEKGNAATAETSPVTWPTADALLGVTAEAGRLLERVEKLDWRLRPLYTASDDDQQPTYEELGALTSFVSAIECDLEAINKCVASLARVRDVACPAVR